MQPKPPAARRLAVFPGPSRWTRHEPHPLLLAPVRTPSLMRPRESDGHAAAHGLGTNHRPGAESEAAMPPMPRRVSKPSRHRLRRRLPTSRLSATPNRRLRVSRRPGQEQAIASRAPAIATQEPIGADRAPAKALVADGPVAAPANGSGHRRRLQKVVASQRGKGRSPPGMARRTRSSRNLVPRGRSEAVLPARERDEAKAARSRPARQPASRHPAGGDVGANPVVDGQWSTSARRHGAPSRRGRPGACW